MTAIPSTTDAPLRLRRVTLATTRMADERSWWTGRLGLPTVPGAPPGGFAVQVGSGVLAFEPVPEGARLRGGARPAEADGGEGRGPSHHVALEVAEDRLVEAAEWLARASPLIALDDGETIIDFPAWSAHSVYVLSPGGHVVELIARHRRPWAPAEDEGRDGAPIHGSRLVRGISEVGICTPDVGALVDRLEALGESLWFGDPQTGFAAVGDESGLLICVREWRPWFPTTDRPAAPGPVAIELTGVRGLVPGEPVPVGSATELLAAPDDAGLPDRSTAPSDAD